MQTTYDYEIVIYIGIWHSLLHGFTMLNKNGAVGGLLRADRKDGAHSGVSWKLFGVYILSLKDICASCSKINFACQFVRLTAVGVWRV